MASLDKLTSYFLRCLVVPPLPALSTRPPPAQQAIVSIVENHSCAMEKSGGVCTFRDKWSMNNFVKSRVCSRGTL